MKKKDFENQVREMTGEELSSKIEKLEQKGGLLKKRENIFYKIIAGTTIAVIAIMIVGYGFLLKHAWDHGTIIKATSYNEAKEESIATELALLEEKLYSKEISPEEYIQLKKQVEGISEHEYFNTLAPESEKQKWQDNQDKITKNVTHTIGTGFAGMGAVLVGILGCGVAEIARIKNKRVLDSLRKESRRRKSKEFYDKYSSKVFEIDGAEK